MIETTQELICNLYKHCKVTTSHSFRVGNDLCGFGRYLGNENQRLNLLVTFITIKTWHYPIQIPLKRRLANSYYAFVYRTSLKMGRLIAMEHTYTVILKEWDCGFYKTFGGVFHRIGEIG